MYAFTEVQHIKTTNPEIAHYAIRTGNHLQQRHADFLMAITQRDGQPVSISFIENPST